LDTHGASYALRPVPARGSPEIVVVSFNAHSGVDGWGRGFDYFEACASFDADVIFLQEAWKPDGREGMAGQIADKLGYESHEFVTAVGRLSGPHPQPGDSWKPRSFRPDGPRVVLPDRARAAARAPQSTTSPTWPDDRRWPHGSASERGSFNTAVLSRLPVLHSSIIDLGVLRYDIGHRGIVRLDVETSAGPVAMLGTHMSHLSKGSPVQFRRIRIATNEIMIPAVLAGDMNLWGPPLVAQLPGWRRAVKGRTWPSWFPHSQPDHILVRGPIRVVSGEVLATRGSDHLPVRARLAIG
jgi:endonuclease/exonuclease/phosphatase family metal-dependent hydrolase